MPFLSIIIPVYNAEKYIRDALDDLLNQNNEEYEIICVNDGSTDASRLILDEYAKKDARIIIAEQENQGGGTARNLGMKMAKGEYLLFLDADDRFSDDLVSTIIADIKKNPTDVYVFKAEGFEKDLSNKKPMNWVFNDNALSEESKISKTLTDEDRTKKILSFTNSTSWNKVVNTDFIRNNAIEFQNIYVVDTMYFVLMALFYANKVTYTDKILLHYRMNNPTGQLCNHDKNPTGIIDAISAVYNRIKDDNSDDRKKLLLPYAVNNSIGRLRMQRSIGAYSKLYNSLKNGGFESMGITDENISLYEDAVNWKKCLDVMNCSVEEMFFRREEEYRVAGFSAICKYYLNDINQFAGKKLVIYGGGIVGKAYFMQLMANPLATIVGWVDKNADNIGFPLKRVDELNSMEYDLILIAISNADIAAKITEELIARGIQRDKIHFEMPTEII